MKFSTRLAALLLLCASAIDANAICFVVPARSATVMTAGVGSSTDYSGGASALLSTCNFSQSQSITDFYAPYFSDMAISNIAQSAGWSHDIESSNDLFHIGGGVIHFSTSTPDAFVPFTYSFTSTFAGIESQSIVVGVTSAGASSTTLLQAGPSPFNGDIFYLPGSPDAVAAFAPAVPEPSSWAMMAGGLALIGWAGKRRAVAGASDAAA